MNIHEYLKTYQPKIYQTFQNALNTSSLSHAYLLEGEEGTPLKEVALYLAKTLVCDHPTPFACNSCPSCLRFDEGSYTDFSLLDGDESSIKKESVLALEKAFSMTSVEEKGVLIYVITSVENMSVEAINSLLKFLEEPANKVYAFLTTSKLNNVLPTIKSRSQTLNLSLIKRETLLKLCKDLDLPQADKELLIPFYNLPSLLYEESQKDRYKACKEALLTTLEAFADNPRLGYLNAHKTILALKERYLVKRVFNYVSLFLKDIVNYSIGAELLFPSYEKLTIALSHKIINPLPLIINTYETTKKLDDNVNISLLIDELFIILLKEAKHE